MTRTENTNYFEDFEVGEVYEHNRGKTVTEMENVLITNMVLNTAQAHFNADHMAETEFGERVVFGNITLALACGLASEDISENAIDELSYDDVRYMAPVFHGDTIYAESEVLSVSESDDERGGGEVTFRVRGFNQDGDQVVGATKTVLLKKRKMDA